MLFHDTHADSSMCYSQICTLMKIFVLFLGYDNFINPLRIHISIHKLIKQQVTIQRVSYVYPLRHLMARYMYVIFCCTVVVYACSLSLSFRSSVWLKWSTRMVARMFLPKKMKYVALNVVIIMVIPHYHFCYGQNSFHIHVTVSILGWYKSPRWWTFAQWVWSCAKYVSRKTNLLVSQAFYFKTHAGYSIILSPWPHPQELNTS